MAVKDEKPAPYGLTPAFERIVAAYACLRRNFYGTVGADLEFARFECADAALAVRAAQAVAKDLGTGPADAILVLQRLRRWQDEGTVTHEQAMEVFDLLEERFVGAHLPDEGAVLAELTPIVRRQMEGDAIRTALTEYGRRGDLEKAERAFQKARSVGVQDRTAGGKLSLASLDRIGKRHQGDRLGMGILDLDVALGGGMMRGCLGLFIAPSKGGKSIALIHQAAHALRQGYFVVLATLELSEEDQEARLIANLTGLPTDVVMSSTDDALVRARLEPLLPTLGVFRDKFFPPKVTPFSEITAWIKEVECEEARLVDLVIVDYIDKLGHARGGDKDRSWQVQGDNTEEMRLYVHGRKCWGWTASQPQRRDPKDRKRRLEIDDTGGAIAKSQAVDLIVTATKPTEDEVELFVAGNRHGKDGFSVGPFPQAFAFGQFVAVLP